MPAVNTAMGLLSDGIDHDEHIGAVGRAEAEVLQVLYVRADIASEGPADALGDAALHGCQGTRNRYRRAALTGRPGAR